MKIKVSWILCVLYILFVCWAFKYDMIQENRSLYAVCFITIPIIIEQIKKIEKRYNNNP